EQHRFAQQVVERDPKLARQLDQDVDAVDLPFTALDLAHPVLGAAHQPREQRLRHATAPPVERHPFPDAQLLASAAHAIESSSGFGASGTRERVARVLASTTI